MKGHEEPSCTQKEIICRQVEVDEMLDFLSSAFHLSLNVKIKFSTFRHYKTEHLTSQLASND